MGDSVVNSCSEEIGARAVRKVYLITYSNANTNLYDREKFSTIVTEAFEAVTRGGLVNQWACCMELHENGAYHFHMCVLLNKLQRWIRVKKYITERHGIVLNFSGHGGYHTVLSYVTKQDKFFITSTDHRNNIDIPKTTRATKKKTSHVLKRSKVKQLSNLEVSKMFLKNKLWPRVALLKFAKSKFSKGDVCIEQG